MDCRRVVVEVEVAEGGGFRLGSLDFDDEDVEKM